MKRKLLAAITLLAAVMTLGSISSPMEVYAISSNNGGGGGGSAHASSDYRAWSRWHQGYRFYMINKDLERVSPVYDFNYQSPSGTTTYYFETRFDTANSPKESSMKTLDWLQSLAKMDCKPPVAVYDNKGRGEEFKQWCFSGTNFYGGSDLSGLVGSSRKSGSSGGSGGSSGGSSGSNKNGIYKYKNTQTSDNPWSLSYSDRSMLKDLLTLSNTKTNQNRDLISIISGTMTEKEFQNTTINMIQSQAKKQADKDRRTYTTTVNEYKDQGYTGEQATTMAYKKLTGSTKSQATNMNYANFYVSSNRNGQKMDSQIKSSITSASSSKAFENSMKRTSKALGALGYKKTTSKNNKKNNKKSSYINPNITETIIPLEELGSKAPLINIMESDQILKIAGFNGNAADAIKSEEYSLVIEPTSWLYIPNGTSYPPSGRMTYGSYYNLAQHWTGTQTGGFYQSYMTKLGNNCLITTAPYTSQSGKSIPQGTIAIRNVAQSVAEMNSKAGLSMHLYYAGESNSTSTYDEPLGDTPGKAPDDSDKLEDKDKTDNKKHANIVKFYIEYGPDGSPVYKDSFTRTPTPNTIMIEDEQTYKVKDWYTSQTYKEASGESPTYENYKSSMTNVQGGTKPGSVTVDPETKDTTLYVLLVKNQTTSTETVDGDWELNESQLTRLEHTTNTDSGSDILSNNPVNVSYGDISGSRTHHPGCDHSEGDYNCVDCENILVDSDITVKLNAINKDNSLISVIDNTTWGDKWIANSIHDSRGSTGSESSGVTGFKYDFISHRGKQDNTRIYTGVLGPTGNTNNSAEQNLITMGFTQGTTKSEQRISNGVINKSLDLTFTAVDGEYKTSSHGDYDGCNSKEDTANVENKTVTGKVSIHTYAGVSNPGKAEAIDTSELYSYPWYGSGGFDQIVGTAVDTNKAFSFTPYIRMRYDNLDSKDMKTYADGKYVRTFKGYDYAEVAWKDAGIGNMHITSNQWSTHKTAYETTGKWNSVLPGGAIFSLDTKDSEQTVAVRTYQIILKGNGLTQAEYTQQVGDGIKETFAKAVHDSTVQSVIAGLETMHVMQYVDSRTNKEDAFEGVYAYPGADISSLKNGSSTASSDKKYYFQEDGQGISSGANEGDLDASLIGTDTTYYTFYSDEKGDVYMMKDLSSSTKLLSQNQKIDALNNSEAKAIDLRTKALTNFLASIERGTGNDTGANWVTNGKWYNEVFNGVTVMVSTSKIKVGFHDPSVRSSILDPKLIPKRDNKAGAYKTMFISQFKCDDITSLYSDNYQIGEFNGEAIYLSGMDMLFTTEKFYIPDATVQDLSR